MLMQACLVALIGIIATIDYNGPLFMLHRPLVTGTLVGLVLGDLTQGIMIGSSLELMWLGVTGIGGYTLIINFIRTPPTFIRTCADECGNPIP
ncbi:hypothetical protein GT516_09900, partial [Collinsella sp. BIOML-A4]|uniref:PTS sugar transporter subunit IIC n=1 Tax=unclassified Collinsella TaxID=2637548 RepID=UPI00136D7281